MFIGFGVETTNRSIPFRFHIRINRFTSFSVDLRLLDLFKFTLLSLEINIRNLKEEKRLLNTSWFRITIFNKSLKYNCN